MDSTQIRNDLTTYAQEHNMSGDEAIEQLCSMAPKSMQDDNKALLAWKVLQLQHGKDVDFNDVKEKVTLEVGTGSKFGARYITKIKVYDSDTTYTSYKNPNVGKKWVPNIPVTPGHKVVFYHKYRSSAYWRYIDISDDDRSLGYSSTTYFTVPASASGDATLHFDSGSDVAYFCYNDSDTTGWIKDEACYPELGE